MPDQIMLEGGYEPHSVEQYGQEKHAAGNAYHPDIAGTAAGTGYSIALPPPNVTGSLHMGHALNHTLQDILARYKRMEGATVLWQPGTDHAGIATQMVVERQLAAEGKTRHDLGREAFIEAIWDWKEKSGNTIVSQQKRLGESCDWTRQRFTMDAGLSKAVRKVFVQLYHEKLIYRDKRLVNWDPKLETAVSDLEVVQKDVQGKMWMLRYPLADDPSQSIVVGTTRPETMLGDTAVAVHPEDDRYRDLVGRKVRLPLVGTEIPIIADEYSDPEKGTGAVKITPAHDFNDFEVGRRHDLPMISVLDATAHINENAPEIYRGLDRFAAREKVLQDLNDLGLLVEVKENAMVVPYGDRSDVVIEPRLTDQWFVDAETLAKPAIAAVENGDMEFVPRNWEKTYFEWMRNIQPWCISRQIWWGHRVPVWYGPDNREFCCESEEEAIAQAQAHYGEAVELRQDTDVLDTWFSSALWPFSTLGWPDKTEALEAFYPTSVLVTGFDIIFFWVARMMMMGLKFMDQVPFKTVYIHALVRDEQGAKMSKSKGNVIDPLTVIEEHGADALRFTLTAMAAMGRDIKLSLSRIEGYRHFCNKIWNAVRFCQLQEGFDAVDGQAPSPVSVADHWITSQLVGMTDAVADALEKYRFNDVASSLYGFVWSDFCDWYLEATKVTLREQPAQREQVLNHLRWVLRHWLKALHPVMPYITEYIWDTALGEDLSIEQGAWRIHGDTVAAIDARAAADFAAMQHMVSRIRSARSENNFPPSAKVQLFLVPRDASIESALQATAPYLVSLARLAEIHWESSDEPGIRESLAEADFWIPFGDHVDIDQETARIEKALHKLGAEIKKMTGKLENPNFTDRAPETVVQKVQAELQEARDRESALSAQLDRLRGHND